MILRALVLLLALVTVSAAQTREPWVAVGQTQLAVGQKIINPAPNDIPALGVVTSLPYTVPPDANLVLESYGVEAYDSPGTANLYPFFGLGGQGNTAADATYRRLNAAMSANTSRSHGEIRGQRLVLPPGTVVNVALTNASSYAGVYAWYLSGSLERLDGR